MNPETRTTQTLMTRSTRCQCVPAADLRSQHTVLSASAPGNMAVHMIQRSRETPTIVNHNMQFVTG